MKAEHKLFLNLFLDKTPIMLGQKASACSLSSISGTSHPECVNILNNMKLDNYVCVLYHTSVGFGDGTSYSSIASCSFLSS